MSLKGVAAVPMGSTLDTRAGEVAVTAAVNGQRARSRQAGQARGAVPRGHLRDPPGAQEEEGEALEDDPAARGAAQPGRRRAAVRAKGPPKGMRVRSLSTTAKGVFRTVGGAATATPAKGTSTFITTDRCDGTITEVGRGRVAVIAKQTGKRTVVRSGRAYIVRARLFAARKGRGG